VAEGVTDQGYYYSAYNYSAAEHGGTHIDAPVHFAEGKKSVEKIGLDQLIGEAVKIDVSAKASADRDYEITVGDIQAWELANGKIPEWAIILFQTGFGAKWPDKKAYLGTDQKGQDAVKDLHFPGLRPDATKWLGENRKFKAVGIDTASIGRGAVDHVRLACHADDEPHSRLRKRRKYGQIAGKRFSNRCVADEDQRRKRRAAADRCVRAGGR
jgi:kynurenine formamidase